MALNVHVKNFRSYVREKRRIMKELFVPEFIMEQMPWDDWLNAQSPYVITAMKEEVDEQTKEAVKIWFELVNRFTPEAVMVQESEKAERLRLAC